MEQTQIIFYVADQTAATRFYRTVIGAEPALEVPGMTEFALPGGAVLGLMPESGIRRLLGEALPDPSLGRGIPRGELYLVVPDPDAWHARARAAGGRELSALAPRDWGHVAAYSLDPDGHVLAFAAPVRAADETVRTGTDASSTKHTQGTDMTRSAPERVVFEEWTDQHCRLPEFTRFLEAVAPDQLPFVVGEYYSRYRSHLIVALDAGDVAGAIRFAIQPIGPEAHCPVLRIDGNELREAKIHVFAVRPASRNRGIGRHLQELAIGRARELGCHQLASYSCYDKEANYHIKLSLGFAAQPEVHGDNEQGAYFLMPLRGKTSS